jgi:phenylpropionate dioxygenase-like ring-hydroxylating dioxygenase large terminal subunit
VVADEVPRIVNYKGAIFAPWDAQAPEFVDYLGDVKDHLDQVLNCRDGRDGGLEVFGGVHKWIIPANWKFAAENLCSDTTTTRAIARSI